VDQEPFILCDNLVKIHKVADLEVVALQGLDLTVYRGELMGIIGPSGSGKTTLMNILGGLARPSAGRVWVDGKDLLKMTGVDLDRYRRDKVGFVWQQSSRNLVPYLTAWENVELPMTLAGMPVQERRKRTLELMELVGVGNRRNSRLGQLSGGEQQRIAIAVALANKPTLLLGDEPTGEVDSATAQLLYDTFRSINRELGLTTLIVSHDPEIARQVNRVVAIRDGKTATETIRQAKSNGNSKENGNGSNDQNEEQEDDHHEEELIELTVLDSAGRLQLPKEYLKHFGIKGRVRIEMAEDGIMIRPAPELDQTHTVETIVTQLEQSRKTGWMQKLVKSIPVIGKDKRGSHDK
jgi:ABC-type lipoprotein export system ATPase subunit/bifunctional DNA-binding transcriptional regulator/antitoxin component of YhaV-PrlF toxin-antitoxin module